MPLKLRPAVLEDARTLTTLMHRSKAAWGYTADQLALIETHDSVTEEQIAAQSVVVAEQDGTALGYFAVEPIAEKTLLLDHLFVAPEAQRRGLGKLLLMRAEDHARTLGRQRVYLESDVHAGPFYEHCGYTTIGTQPSKLMPGAQAPLMEKRLEPQVHPLTDLKVRLSTAPWHFEEDNSEAIAAHFAQAQAKNPHIWNGRTLKLTGYTFKKGVFAGTCCETSFAAYLAWRDWGAPDASAFNLFGSAVLISSDGALLYGVMAPHTATAGLIYPPGGNLDPSDVDADGYVDLEAAIYRELEEETGLSRNTTTEGPLYLASDGPRISIAKVIFVDLNAHSLRTQILHHSKASDEQELSDIKIYRRPEELTDPSMLPYARALGAHVLSTIVQYAPSS
ncbi:N-acetylglutamate synthase-like GNAT family acetyltransferase [Roseibium hamelinense]|uniref:N-acetylglutamate synthase-like GNAT family acetyltransferase n=1 Tax=Roseibium hamelinense TaxID=150831 RepID=A0A562T9L5_9HYPH|nr:GNAT family N-acetyltransferase [Roseibium hamelinense]MTI45377.1 GNAT family N-acetyltransferase [Roseibium hamelinense]TWI90252.1 N-acetylglutamate synthase-like GNAT family acetyltransferase [Roseibium hamelinense]